jgi:hypothetical protein
MYAYIMATAKGCGTITPAGIIRLGFGVSQTFIFTPSAGCKIVDVKVDGESVPTSITSGRYTFTNLQQSHTIHVEFERPDNAPTIFATAGTNGKITPAGLITVKEGGSQTFIFTPNSGYKIESVVVNTQNIPAAVTSGIYTFTKVTGENFIHVTFVNRAMLGMGEAELADFVVYSHQNIVYINTVETRFIASLPITTVEIYDMVGRRIHQSTLTGAETAITLNVTSGIYTVRLISPTETILNRKVSITR